MITGPICCADDTTVAEAARTMADNDIGALPVCDSEGRLRAVITDREMADKFVAAGRDPRSVRLSELVDCSEVVTIGADDTVEVALRTMNNRVVRRVPVIDATYMIGIVS